MFPRDICLCFSVFFLTPSVMHKTSSPLLSRNLVIWMNVLYGVWCGGFWFVCFFGGVVCFFGGGGGVFFPHKKNIFRFLVSVLCLYVSLGIHFAKNITVKDLKSCGTSWMLGWPSKSFLRA